MRHMHSGQLDMFVRTTGFGDKHSDVITASSAGGQLFLALAALVGKLKKYAVSNLSAARQAEGRQKVTLRTRVIEELETIARCARLIARDTSGFGVEFQLGRLRSSQAVLTTGRLFAEAAPQYHSQFVASGMPETFVSDLTKLLDAFEASIKSWEDARKERSKARVGLEATLASANTIVGKLDIVVAKQFRDDPETLAEWAESRRVDLPRRARRKHVDAIVPPAPPVAAAPAESSSKTTPVVDQPAASGQPAVIEKPVVEPDREVA